MNPDLLPLVVGGGVVLLALAGLAAFSSRRTRLASPSVPRAAAALQEAFEPEVEHREALARTAEEAGSAVAPREDEAPGPR